MGEVDLAEVDRLLKDARSSEQMGVRHFVAQYLSRRGKEAEAVAYWKMCMTHLPMHDDIRTLAGAELLKRGHGPESYQELLRKPREPQKP